MTLEALVKKEGVKSFYNHELPTAAVKPFVPKEKQTVVFVPDPVDAQLFYKIPEAATKTVSCRKSSEGTALCCIGPGELLGRYLF